VAGWGRTIVLASGLTAGMMAPGLAAKLPPCPPKHAQLFIAPMGEPFRAPADAPYPMATWFAGADSNGDGKLSFAEYIADADRFFAKLDSDHDGEILPEEVTAYEKTVPEIALYGHAGGDRLPRKSKKEAYGGPLGAGRWGLLNIPQPVSSADTDYNRAVSREEFRAAAKARFDQLDVQSNGGPTGALILARLPKPPALIEATVCDPNRPWPKPKARD
jgi:hypothetical protein